MPVAKVIDNILPTHQQLLQEFFRFRYTDGLSEMNANHIVLFVAPVGSTGWSSNRAIIVTVATWHQVNNNTIDNK